MLNCGKTKVIVFFQNLQDEVALQCWQMVGRVVGFYPWISSFVFSPWHRLSKLISAHMAKRKRWFSPFHLPFNYGKASTSIYSAHLPIRKRLSPSCKGFSLFYFDTKRNGLYFSVSTSFTAMATPRKGSETNAHSSLRALPPSKKSGRIITQDLR